MPTSGGSAPVESKRDNLRMAVFGFVGFLVILLIAVIGFTTYRVYARAATDSFTTKVASALRLPAFKVNGETVSYSDYVEDLKAIRTFRTFSQTAGGAAATMTDEQLSDQVLQRLATNHIVARLAAQRNVKVEDADYEVIHKELLTQFKDDAAINAELVKRYGWDMATYKMRVMNPYILQGKLNEAISGDQGAHEEARQAATKVLAEIKGGADFAMEAQKYGQDGTASQGGDLGWFGKGEMVPQFEAAIFSLKPGQLSDEPIETPYGFHIVKLEEKKMVKGKDANGKATTNEQVHARHILFAFPTLDKLLADEIKNAKVNLYLKVHNPFIIPAAVATPPAPAPSTATSTQ